MARKLALDLTIEQTRMLHEVAQRRAVLATGDQRVRWQAIEREAARALAFEDARKKDVL